VWKLGKELRRISEKIAASGEKPLTRRELEREIANRRTGDFWPSHDLGIASLSCVENRAGKPR
jgi:hypothetical protein